MVFEPSPEVCGKISMLDDERETIGAALMWLGYPINDTDPAHLEEAKNVLIQQAPCVLTYDSQTNDDLIIQGETVIGHMWTGDALLAGLPVARTRRPMPSSTRKSWPMRASTPPPRPSSACSGSRTSGTRWSCTTSPGPSSRPPLASSRRYHTAAESVEATSMSPSRPTARTIPVIN